MKHRWSELKHRSRRFVESLTTPERRGEVVFRSRSQELAKALPIAILLVLPLLIPQSAFAQSDGGITTAAWGIYKWVRVIGGVVMCLGFAGVGFKLMFAHDREGLKPLYCVIGGGFIMLMGPAFVTFLASVTGGAGGAPGIN